MLIWVCSCMTFQYIGWNIFIIFPNIRGEAWRCTYFGAKLVFIAGIFLKKYPWCIRINFQFHFLVIWSISASILYIIVLKSSASNWCPSDLAMFLKIDPCFGPFGKYKDTKEISMKTVHVSSWFLSNRFQVASYKLRVTSYYLFHELRVKFYVRVTSYYLLHELRVTFYIRVTSYYLLTVTS